MTTHIETIAGCYSCDWQAAGVHADKAAEKHTRDTTHGTWTSAEVTK